MGMGNLPASRVVVVIIIRSIIGMKNIMTRPDNLHVGFLIKICDSI